MLARAFHPGQESLIDGLSRAESVIQRVLEMTEADVARELGEVMRSFADRHVDLPGVFRRHYTFVAHRMPVESDAEALTEDRQLLIGACLTQESSIEGAALFNPSIVAHPDQSGCADGTLRFLLSVRAVGEGHVSSVEFRTGTLMPGDVVVMDEPERRLGSGVAEAMPMTADFLRAALDQTGDAYPAESILRLLPATFTPTALDDALSSSALDSPGRAGADGLLERIRRLAASSYRLSFPREGGISSRVIIPGSPTESGGLEDVRLVRFVDDDGSVTYLGTYTAFDGSHVAPHLLRTTDFEVFEASPMIGPAAQNKGMAVFPRRIDGHMWALSRWDRENISVARSADGVQWGSPRSLVAPVQPWEVIQLGVCSSPIETDAGWLVITHGVGPMRVYSLGAMLLDRDDPTRVLGVLSAPLLSPQEDERDGYVPNVVYSCGALVHGSTLVIPYGCSDASIRFAFTDLDSLLARLRPMEGDHS